ncbi:MAG: radical SAM protein [Elusimicrobiota bacterium]|jgi:radical SAM superfamily enzyme YgiQ (UPF0313 family)
MNPPRRLRILLIKPCRPSPTPICQPPLGILYLISSLRRRFGTQVDVSYRDLRLHKESLNSLAPELSAKYDLIGISALNCEAQASHALSSAIRALSPNTVIALGGPYARSAPDQAMSAGGMDWIFNGEAERTFPQAVEERFFGRGDLSSVAGLSWRAEPGGPFISNDEGEPIQDLDALPMPAWDLVPFDVYARRHNMNGSLRARRYAPLLTSRGCPYRCSYCHDIFGKGFRRRSPDNVLEEIELLKDRCDVKEFQIIDDIYNLDKPRMRTIAKKVIERYNRRALFFTFPNGIRGDIMDPADLPLLREMGVYDMTIAVETVSDRLQKLIRKNLNIGKVRRIIDAAADAGISVKAFFMLGFPTETREELERTLRFALESRLTIAHFFFVIPQPGTPLHDLAKIESPQATTQTGLDDYYAEQSWYELAYGFDMARFRRDAMLRFYLRPRRILRVLRRINLNQLLLGGWQFFNLTAVFGRRGKKVSDASSQKETTREVSQ